MEVEDAGMCTSYGLQCFGSSSKSVSRCYCRKSAVADEGVAVGVEGREVIHCWWVFVSVDASFVGQSNICAACLERRRQRCSCLVALVGDVSKALEIFIYASWFVMPMDSWGEPRAMWPEVVRFLQL